jgi:hypothetical protein
VGLPAAVPARKIAAQPVPSPTELQQYLASQAWTARFDDEVLAHGAKLRPRVKNPTLRESAPGSLELAGSVDDAECGVDFWPQGNSLELETFCSCGNGGFCAHAAALLLRASRERSLESLSHRRPAEAIASHLAAVAPPAPLSAPPPAAVIAPAPRFVLHLARRPTDRKVRMILQSHGGSAPDEWITAEARVCYGEHCGPLRATAPTWEECLQGPDGSPLRLRHDAAAENTAARQLQDTGLSSLTHHPAWRFLAQLRSRETDPLGGPDLWFPDPARVPVDAFWHQFRGEWVAKLEALGWSVTIDESVGHRVHFADPDDWLASLEDTEGGWFSLSVGFDVAGQRYDLLPILAGLLESDFLEETLERPENGHVYAPLANGDALRLPVGRVRRILRQLAALIDPKFPARTKLHALDAAALAGAGSLGIDPPPELAELAARLRNFSGIDPIAPPAGLRAELREYQLAGFRWMQFLARHGLHGILADDMGLGKTLQTITHILTEKDSGRSTGKPALVVAPTSVVPNWRAEITRFAPSLRVLVLQGPERSRYFRSIPHADVVLTSFALLGRDVEKLRRHPFHLAILDEAQNIKNPRAQVAQAACKLDARHRLCLSGTPVENHLGELWSLMRFLIPGFLGSEENFQSRFRKPIEKDGCPERTEDLKRRVAPLILRRTKDQVARELPPKTEIIHLVELHTGQKDLYETVRATMDKRVREAMAARGTEGFQMVFLDALLKLRQICCHPGLLPENYPTAGLRSAKLDHLVELLDVLLEEGRRILIFSQFTSMLDRISTHLGQAGVRHLMLTGSSKDRGALVTEFQTGRIPLFLISLKAGGTGLNLTAADTVIHYDPWWNPAAENQATDRAYRIGQDKPVFVHKLLCQNTVEQRIHQLQQDKSRLAAGLLGDADISLRLDASMVRALLSE